jgi:hypothetical protein
MLDAMAIESRPEMGNGQRGEVDDETMEILFQWQLRRHLLETACLIGWCSLRSFLP